jgi:hypothetical protein
VTILIALSISFLITLAAPTQAQTTGTIAGSVSDTTGAL